ncbi:MAG: DUF4126 domain-containing protein [Acidobacteriaceae bacterium]|jgi:uncharacterized membrane protein
MSWVLAIPLLGLATGLRSLTPMAVLCWFAYLGYLPVDGTWASWTARVTSVAIFTALAVGEYVADKLPQTPNRITPGPLLARLVLGGLVGSIAATAMNGPGLEGVLLGVIGAALGAFAGFMIRRDIVEALGWLDWPVALAEDLFTLICAIFAMHVVTS